MKALACALYLMEGVSVMLQHYRIENEQAVPTTDAASQWLAVTAPTADELTDLAAACGLPVHRLQGLLDVHEDPRVAGLDPNDNVPGLIVLRYPEEWANKLGMREYRTYPLSLILLEDRVVTLSQYPLPESLMASLVRGRWLNGQPEEFALHVLWCTLRAYVDVMDAVNEQVTAIEQTLGRASRNEQLYEIMALQKSLIYIDSVLDNTMPVLKALRRGERYFATASYDDALAAVMVEAHQARTMTGVTERILEQFNTTVGAVVSNNLNIIMKVLTSITIILTIPTVIGGLWGMNVPVPLAGAYWAFWGICAGCAVLCGITAYILWRHDYF